MEWETNESGTWTYTRLGSSFGLYIWQSGRNKADAKIEFDGQGILLRKTSLGDAKQQALEAVKRHAESQIAKYQQVLEVLKSI